MRRYEGLVAGMLLPLGLLGCGAASGAEPSEADMKEAMLYAMNPPPGVTISDPVTIKFFKKEACDKPTPQGYHCTFDVQVASANLGASMYNNIPGADFYQDKAGKWVMRP